MRKILTSLLLLVILAHLGVYYLDLINAESTTIILRIRVYIESGNNIFAINSTDFGVYIDKNLYHSGDDIAYPFGNHRIVAIFPSGYSFLKWGSSYDIQISDTSSQNTTALFTGNVIATQIIGGKAYSSLYFILTKGNSGSGSFPVNIIISDAVNNKQSEDFLPLEKIKITTDFSIKLNNYRITSKGSLTIHTIVLSSVPVFKRINNSLQTVSSFEFNKTIPFSNSNTINVSYTFPDGNYEIGLPNKTGSLEIAAISDIKITLDNTFNSNKIYYSFSSFNITQINIMSVIPHILEIKQNNDSYIISFALYWQDNSRIIKNKENVIALNLYDLKISSQTCDANGFINFTLKKSSLRSLIKGFNGSLTFYAQYLDGGIIPFSYPIKLYWDVVATMVLEVSKESIFVKLVRLSDFAPIANATIMLIADNMLIFKTKTDSLGYAKLFIQNNFNYNILKIEVMLNNSSEILIDSQYADIIIYSSSWP